MKNSNSKGAILNRRKPCRYLMLAVLPAALILSLLPWPFKPLYAMFDETQAVHIKADEMEDGTLAIGTHLIYLEAMNDELYSLAKQSAKDSGQTEMYYKSELGDGAWYAISGAASLSDITEKGSRTDNDLIEGLSFTYHTKSDGITYDLRTDEPVNAFDIVSPYHLNELPELEELRNQMQALQKSGIDVSILEAFFDTGEKFGKDSGGNGDGTEEGGKDNGGNGDGTEEGGKDNGGNGDGTEEGGKSSGKSMETRETKELDKQMESLYEYQQRLRAAGEASDKLDMVSKAMERVDAQRRYETGLAVRDRLNVLLDEIASSKILSAHLDLPDAAGNCMKEVQSSIDAADAKRLQDTEESTLSSVGQVLIQELLKALESGDDNAAGARLDEMGSLYSIMNGLSLNPEKEKALLDDRIIPRAKQIYGDLGSSTAENELKYYENLRAQIGKSPKGDEEEKTLYNQKQDLKEQRLSALDKNNLVEAKKAEALIEAVDNKIRKLEADNSLPIDNEEEIANAIEKVEGASLDSDSAKESSAALAGLAMFCEQMGRPFDSSAKSLLKSKAKLLSSKKEGDAFENPKAANKGGYAPVNKLARFGALRYVWNKNQKKAILARGSTHYEFTAFSDVVIKNGRDKEKMEVPALFEKAIYLPKAYAEKEFSCQIYKLADTGYSVLLDQETKDKAAKVCELLCTLTESGQ